MIDCVVVGAGILGATIAQALRKHMEVMVVDAHFLRAGTRPSGGHLKPSWFGGMKKEEYEPAMQLLDETWGLSVEEFSINTLGVAVAKTKVFRVDTDKVETKHIVGQVLDVKNVEAQPVISVLRGDTVYEYRCKYLIVATGVWANAFDFGVDCQPKQGVSFRMRGKLTRPFIVPWAPYKQIVAHQQTENSIWIGDGSAILSKNWTDLRTAECLQRCSNALGKKIVTYRKDPPAPLETRKGLRAYCEHPKSDPCLFKQVGPNAFLVTGAGKSGTIAAGWAARKVLQHVGC